MDFTNPVLNADWPDPDVVRVDDDGRAYLVHGWARSRSGLANRLTMVEVDSGRTGLAGTPRTVLDGDDLPGYHTLEGPKLYRRDGWYWIFAPAGGVATGWQSVFRARDIFGPYEGRVVLAQGSTPVNGPHQGAWVDTPAGEHWFPHFQDRGVFGRVVHLQPMSWQADGWPVIGAGGEPVLAYPAPSSPGTRAGLVVLGAEYAWLGTITFAWRTQGVWREVGTGFPATAGRWIGADVGVFAAAPLGAPNNLEHVTFGPVSVDVVGVEEVAA